MERKIALNIAAVLLFCFALFAVFFVLQKSKDNSFEINRDNIPADTEVDTGKDTAPEKEITPPQDEEEKTTVKKDLAPLVEKYKGKEIVKINTDQKAVALTFDAGANADGVEPILRILAENDIKGTFFLTGKFIEKYPDKVRAIVATGGDVGNHTYDHPYLTRLTNEQIKENIQEAENAFAKLDGKFQPFLRSPYGDRNASTLLAVSENNYLNIRWTVDSLGWQGTSGGMSKGAVEQKVLKAAGPGAIIMMHLGSNPDDKTHLDSEALPAIITELKKNGYEFMTLSELFELEK
ncbi:MAG: polysaccharide deacetylase family protein [Patescibacteria group bacterium]